MPNFECLFFLENVFLQLIEVKRTGLDEGAQASEKFKWLKIGSFDRSISKAG